MRVYNLYLAKPLQAIYALVPILYSVVVVTVLLTIKDGPPLLAFTPIIGVMALWAYFTWRIAYRISVGDDGSIEFRSLLRRMTVSPLEIVSVKARRYGLGFLIIRHRHGKVHLVHQIDGFYEFLTNLKAANPAVEIKGC